MKKFLLTLLILLGLGSLTACQLNFDPVYGEHEHEITGEFGYYEQIHWNICATCDEKVDKAWHNFGPWQRVSDDSLEERRTCLCGYYESRFHSHSLTGNVLYDDNEHYEECEKCFDHVNAVAHTYGEWTVGRESTEDVQGYELQVCSCGHTVYRSLPLKNHVHVWDGTYSITEDAHWKNCVKESCTMDEVDLLVPHNGGQATCTEDAVCVDCGYHYKEAFGHTEVTDVAVAPTCTESGLTEGSHCSVCNEVLVAQQTIDALGHDYESVVTNPTCTEKGYTTHTCKKGDHTYVDSYVDELGHDYNSVVTAPTCTEDGYTTYTCKNDATHTYVGDEVAATGHSPAEAVEENRVGSSCTVAGHYDSVVYCSVCDKELSRTKVDLELLPHTEETLEAVAPKCEATGLTEGKKCSVCDKVLVAQQEIPAVGHTGGTATQTEQAICSVCGEGYGLPLVYAINGALPTGLTYITNNSSYPKPSYYGNGGLKMNYEKMGVLSEVFEAEKVLTVILNVLALNENSKTGSSEKYFTIYGLDAEGNTVAEAALTSVAIGNINSVVLTSESANIVQVKVIMTGYPHNGNSNKYCNVSLGGISVYSGELVTEKPETITNIKDALTADDGASLEIEATVVSVAYAWSDSSSNMSVYLRDDSTTDVLYVYKLATKVSLGDVIKVTGTLVSYEGTKQIVAGATAEIVSSESSSVNTIVDALAANPGATATLTGTVKTINTAWNSEYNNMSITLEDENCNTIYVYRLATEVEVGNNITVSGSIEYGYSSKINQVAAGATAVINTTITPDPEEPETPTTGVVATFDFGENGEAKHVDGDSLGTAKTYENGDYTLELTDVVRVYGEAFDEKGNSCIKLGTSSAAASLTFVVPNDVLEVIVYVAGYKQNAGSILINGGSEIAITTLSYNGEYTAIKINTKSVKTINISTTSNGYRAMINKIEYSTTDVSNDESVISPSIITLSTPVVTVSNEGLASWVAVNHAVGYIYQINGGEETSTTDTSIQLKDGYTIVVKAVGDGIDYASSEFCEGVKYEAPAADTEVVLYSTGFESSDGFTASTSYNNTKEKATGNAGTQWNTYYGTPSTNSVVSGSQSMQMRWYKTAVNNLGYTYMNFDLEKVSSLSFSYKTEGAISLKVSYSTDGGTTWNECQVYSSSTSKVEKVITFDEVLQKARFKFEITYATTPTTKNCKLFIDDVVIKGYLS